MRALRIVCSVVRAEEKALLARAPDYGFDPMVQLVGTDVFQSEMTGSTDDAHRPVTLIRTPSFFAATQIAAIAKASGDVVINSTKVVSLFGQKVTTDSWLAQHDLCPIPNRTVFCEEAALKAAADLGYPVVAKPSIGGFGKMIQVLRDPDELRNYVELITSFAPSSHRSIYLQQQVDILHDIRVVLIGGQIIASFSRELPEGSSSNGPRNVAQGAVGHPFALAPEDVTLMERLGQATSADFLGVDLLIDQSGKRFICDVNPVCRFEEAARVTGTDIVGHILTYAKAQA